MAQRRSGRQRGGILGTLHATARIFHAKGAGAQGHGLIAAQSSQHTAGKGPHPTAPCATGSSTSQRTPQHRTTTLEGKRVSISDHIGGWHVSKKKTPQTHTNTYH